MKNSTVAVLGFIFGGAVGAAITYKALNSKFAKESRQEIDAVREVYKKKLDELNSKSETGNMPAAGNRFIIKSTEVNRNELDDILNRVKEYSGDSNNFSDAVSRFNAVSDAPYVIAPEEFGELDDYECISLIYYAGDDVLADDQDELVDDIEETVGADFSMHYGEYEDDAVYIRNDARMCDYEILLDRRKYSEIPKRRP